MVFSLKAFCSYADELARLLKLLNDIIQTNGLIVISNKNKNTYHLMIFLYLIGELILN